MLGIVVLLSCLVLLGAAVGWRASRRAARAVPACADYGEDLLPESAGGEPAHGLAAFYAYQLGAGRIDGAR